MQLANIVRYGLWCGILATAEANRREYAMKTTWLPHLLTNSASLLLPDLFRVLVSGRPVEPAPPPEQARQTWAEAGRVLGETLAVVVRDNPRYVVYVTPLAAGYLLSHPRFNIYKGELAEIQLAGFTLDALPHGATAFALTALVHDMVQVAASSASREGALAGWLDWGDRNPALLSALVLALATLIWEVGEYRIYRHEMRLRGDPRRINMQWSPVDTLYDCVANAIGWALATAWHQARPHAAVD